MKRTNQWFKNLAASEELLKFYWTHLFANFDDLFKEDWLLHGTCFSPSGIELGHVPAEISEPVGQAISSFKGGDNRQQVNSYLGLVINLAQHYNVYSRLESQGIAPSAELVKSSDIRQALKTAFEGKSVGLYCEGDYLTEVRVCLNNNFVLHDCPNDENKCLEKLIYKL